MSEGLRLQVFTVEFGGYQSARIAAEEFVRERPEFALQSWDLFELSTEEMRRYEVSRYPTVRLYRGQKLLGENSCAIWWLGAMRKFVNDCLAEESRAPDDSGSPGKHPKAF